jgi:hypothetical protein
MDCRLAASAKFLFRFPSSQRQVVVGRRELPIAAPISFAIQQVNESQ